MNVKNKITTLFLVFFTLFSCKFAFASPDEIYLFRHSEKQSGKNPSLTEQGKIRANNLVLLFKKYKNVHVFSSNYNRTLQTAQPLAKHFNTSVNIYNASELTALKSKLFTLDGVVVVIGHSNTTPVFAELLSSEKVSLMAETDFTRYFLLKSNLDKSSNQYSVSELTMDF
ncbi:histidine phosphatase family protein [Pseudoalteromonas sp. SWXJZ94C]|uniref:SixA phosphatase family protein n=1 Tax=unclassified Pseudoalteromonas TaxID=194690 RepID=UPI00140BC280|nr:MULTISPECIES: histidine phosphatase family protein [unclassified Pseudoalteromonas]MBH0056387.1 histidine phosphatase family protein [Pseudoalteromonas sp. SWXJZ94C]